MNVHWAVGNFEYHHLIGPWPYPFRSLKIIPKSKLLKNQLSKLSFYDFLARVMVTYKHPATKILRILKRNNL